MRTRRRSTSISMDSFLDIVTNVVGVMVLIAVLTVLISRDISITLGTPVLHKPPREAQPVYFECRRNRIVPIDPRSAMENVRTFARKHGDSIRELNENDVGNRYYRLKFEGYRLVYKPRAEVQGETGVDLARPGSNYVEALTACQSDSHYPYFMVREDSFEVFRLARKIARARGLETGWMPLQSRFDLASGGSGNKPDVQ